MERTALSISGRVAGFQTPFTRRMEPELKQDVIGFERGVGGQFGAPVAVALPAGQPDRRRRARMRLLGGRVPACCRLEIGALIGSMIGQLRGQREAHILFHQFDLFQSVESRVRARNSISSCTRCSGRRGAGRHGHVLHAFEPRRIHFAAIVHQVGADAEVVAHFHQALGIGAVLRTHHQQQIADRRDTAFTAIWRFSVA